MVKYGGHKDNNMSWWISLVDKNKRTIDTDTVRTEGGTYVLGGSSEATLNVTYNYRKHFNFREVDGLSAVEADKIMCAANEKLGDDEDEDYWKATEGNVKRAITTLIEFAEYAMLHNIDCIFQVH